MSGEAPETGETAPATCPQCGAAVPPGAHFCTSCGAPLQPGLLSADEREARRKARDRRLIIWGVLGLAVLGVLGCNALLIVLSAPDAVALVLSALAAIIPAYFYTRIVLRMDRYEREPRRTVLMTFLWGAIFATFGAGILNAIGAGIFGAAVGPDDADTLTATFVAPVVEESLKGIALLVLFLIFRDEFDNVLDGLVYGALVGLGFAMTENISYFSMAYVEDGALGFGVLVGVRTISGMFGHAMWTSITGAGLGWARNRSGSGRFAVPVLAWMAAMTQHGLWNGLLTFSGTLGAFLVALGFMVLGLVTVLVIWRVALGRERAIIARYLADEVSLGTLSQAELETLTDDKARRRALKAAGQRGGRPLRQVQQQYFQAAAELAFRKFHLANGERPKASQAHTPEEDYRAELARLRGLLAA